MYFKPSLKVKEKNNSQFLGELFHDFEISKYFLSRIQPGLTLKKLIN